MINQKSYREDAKKISLLGSTGSIGRQTLQVMDGLGLSPVALTANKNVKRLERQARKYNPAMVAAFDESAARSLKVSLADTGIRVMAGMDGLVAAAVMDEVDTVVNAVVGMVGLLPTWESVKRGKQIALANKETLVCAGELIMQSAREHGAQIIPVDSEHSAIFQCLQGCRDMEQVKKLILTASGGPFFGLDRAALSNVTLEDALAHPNWDMGAKVTIDSATLMNKGLELIEAMRLYDMPPDQIDVVVHRESIIHSLVEFTDGSVLAQLGLPDMRLPIQYALTWPDRKPSPAKPLDLLSCGSFHFDKPDPDTFTCFRSAMKAARNGGTACAILNGANEAAVDLFLRGKIGFLSIGDIVEKTMDAIGPSAADSLKQIQEADRAAREFAYSTLK